MSDKKQHSVSNVIALLRHPTKHDADVAGTAAELHHTLNAAEMARYAMHNASTPQDRDTANIRYSKMLELLFEQLSAMRRKGEL